MTYRITIGSNPRIMILAVIIIGLPGFGIASIFLWNPIAGIIIAVVGGFIGYNLFKLTRSILASRIVTGEEGISFDFGKGHLNEFRWDEITHAGKFFERSNKPSFFVYDEPNDRLITVPNEYDQFDQLLGEVETALGDIFETIDIGTSISINEYLRSRISPEDEENEDDDSSQPTEGNESGEE